MQVKASATAGRTPCGAPSHRTYQFQGNKSPSARWPPDLHRRRHQYECPSNFANVRRSHRQRALHWNVPFAPAPGPLQECARQRRFAAQGVCHLSNVARTECRRALRWQVTGVVGCGTLSGKRGAAPILHQSLISGWLTTIHQ